MFEQLITQKVVPNLSPEERAERDQKLSDFVAFTQTEEFQSIKHQLLTISISRSTIRQYNIHYFVESETPSETTSETSETASIEY